MTSLLRNGLVEKGELTCSANARMLMGDCNEVMMNLEAGSVNLMMTSPPYADMRAKQYGGIPHGQYVDWWMEHIEPGLRHCLAADGSIVVNIKENTIDGCRSTYVMELTQAMIAAGWRWIDEFIWVKTSTTPGKWPTRLKDAWERCLHFSLNAEIKFRHDNCLEENTEAFNNWLQGKMARQSIDVKQRHGSPHTDHSRDYSAFAKLQKTLPANVVVAPNAASCKASSLHAAPYHPRVPGFFIGLLTDEGDTVLDPFAGTGTTCWQALHMGRNAIGAELMEEYYDLYPKIVADFGWQWYGYDEDGC